MSNNNDTEKAIITLGKIFKVFALIVTVLIIALIVYLFSNADVGDRGERIGNSNFTSTLYPIPSTLL